jgi:modification target Cys-rich repeat protein
MKAKLSVLLGVFALAGVMVVYGAMAPGCDEDSLCGPCGSVAYGDSTISGDARLDGLFKAVSTLGASVGSIRGNFDADIRELAAAFGVDAEGKATAALAAEVKAAIQAELNANIQGGLSVDYAPPKCSADINVSVEAQAQCEAKLGCEGGCDAGSVDVKCEGSCQAECKGGCEGELKCSAELNAQGKCEAECKGSCELQVPTVNCEGSCTGECDGTCEAEVEIGEGKFECRGTCQGTCKGKCEYTPANAQCQGTCKGECVVTVEAEAECTGSLKCEGSCTGSCSGGCEGTVTPPSCDIECDASADCKAQASAQASASLKCEPPRLDINFGFKAGVDAKAKAEFLAKMEVFKVKMIGIVKGWAELEALVNGNAEVGIEAPVVTIKNEVQAIISGGIGSFNVAAGLVTCVLPAFREAGEIIGQVGTDGKAVIQGQIEMLAIIGL